MIFSENRCPLFGIMLYACPMTQSPHERDEAQRREALAALRELSERDTLATSALARTARRAGDHFAAKDAGEDRIELWGRRIGRALSLAGLIALAIYLYFTHFR
jgi:ferric-dicitrate binding protein FerR (iron transport regulator)